MPERKPLIVGNWKMELSYKAELEVGKALQQLIKNQPVTADVVVCPSFVSVISLSEFFKDNPSIHLGAQNMHYEEKGAATGQISVLQIYQHCTWVILGHSEVRAITHEDAPTIQRKASLALKYGLTPIVCLGESAAERESGQTLTRIAHEMDALLETHDRSSLANIVLAYEPLWAIGSGVQPDPGDAASVLLYMRKLIAQRYDQELAEKVRMLYGGSVTEKTVGQFIAEPGVDGVLVGGASVHPKEFVDIISLVQKTYAR